MGIFDMQNIKIVGYQAGALGKIVALHGTYYAQHWNLGLYFEAKVATEMAEFLNRFDPMIDGAWFAQVDDEVVGEFLLMDMNNMEL